MRTTIFRKYLNTQRLLLIGLLTFSAVPVAGQFKFLDGNKKIIYVLHDSVDPTSRLRSWVENYYGGALSCPIKVVAGTQGRYLGVGYLDGQSTATGWVKSFSADAVRTAAGVSSDWPVVVMALTNFREGDFVRGPQDTASVNRIAKELTFACDELVKRGAARVIWSTYHFNYSHRRLAEYEPLVVQAFRKLTSGHLAADMVTATDIRNNPGVNTMSGDRRHCTYFTFAKYGHTWLKSMADHDGVAMPSWCDEWLETERQKTIKSQSAIRVLSPMEGKLRVGEKMTIKWEMDYGASMSGVWAGGTLDRVGVALEFRRMDLTQENRSINATWENLFPATDCPTGSRSLPTICASASQKTYETTITIDQKLFTAVNLAIPFPVNVLISSPDLWKEHYSTSTVDWDHPENMIVLYPAGADLDAPVYPEGLSVRAARLPGTARSGQWGPVYPVSMPWSGGLHAGQAVSADIARFDLSGKVIGRSLPGRVRAYAPVLTLAHRKQLTSAKYGDSSP